MGNYFYKGLDHIGIRTSDIEKSAAFYVENLGFTRRYFKDLGRIRLCFLENNGFVVELLDNGEQDTDGRIDHFAMEVQGMEALIAELKEKGVAFETEEAGIMKDMFAGNVRNIFLKGPSGERIELFEYLLP